MQKIDLWMGGMLSGASIYGHAAVFDGSESIRIRSPKVLQPRKSNVRATVHARDANRV